MNRAELIERVAKRARERYGQDFRGSLFDDLLDDGLIPGGRRNENVGKHPVYEFDCASYRRALQIVRLRSKGIVGRDAIRVQLFLRKYSHPVLDVRDALRKEYVAAAKSLSNQVRSGYAGNWKSVAPKHKESLAHQMGTLDPRFEAAGMRLSDDQIIQAVRTAKQEPINSATDIQSERLREKLRAGAPPEELLDQILQLFSGSLMVDGDRDSRATEIDDMEKLIIAADDDAFLRARRLHSFIVRSQFGALSMNMVGAGNEQTRHKAADAAATAILDQPNFAAHTLAICLRAVLKESTISECLSTDDDCDNLLNMLRYFCETTNPADRR